MACFALLAFLLNVGKGELQMLRFFSLQNKEEEEENQKK